MLLQRNQINNYLSKKYSLLDLVNSTALDETPNNQSNPEEKKKFECRLCSKLLSSAKFLRHHQIRIHSDCAKVHQCAICPMAYRLKCDLDLHKRRVHFRPFMCVICEKSFANGSELSNHQIKHSSNEGQFTDLMKYHCSICHKGFSSRKHHKSHIREHDHPFTCHHCQKHFLSELYLTRHKRTPMHKQRLSTIHVENNIFSVKSSSEE